MLKTKKILITGGAGFIGFNLVDRYLSNNYQVTIIDNLSRKGAKENLKQLSDHKKNRNLKFINGDIVKNLKLLHQAIDGQDIVLHLAAQVAVTSSLINPFEDFKINTLGTLNILEAIRKSNSNPILIYSSTNKVYGRLENIEIEETKKSYKYKTLKAGISEKQQLDFYSPYGCSTGSADQYVRDYARIYGLRTIIFRKSCIYGPRQFGIEDQGWIAWFIIAALLNKEIKIYGNGKQTRDILYIDDLMQAYVGAIDKIDKTSGQIYNIGGGTNHTISLLELITYLEKLLNKKIKYSFHNQRPGDQLIYISDTNTAKRDFNWMPSTTVSQGLIKTVKFIKANYDLIEKIYNS